MKFSGTITLQYDTPYSPFRAIEYKEALKWLADSGFDGAEVCISNYGNLDIETVKQDLNRLHLGCSTISTGQSRTLEDISLLHAGEKLKKAQCRMKEHINAAAVLGSKVTLGLLRGLGTEAQEQEDRCRLARNLEPIIDYAQQKGVMIVLEAINRYETRLFNSVRSAVSFLDKELGNPSCIGILWDTFHANIEDSRFEEAVACMGSKLQHVHIADSNRMFPGYGHIDFETIYQLLEKAGYDQYLSYECLNQPSVQTVRCEAGHFISQLKKCM